MKKAIYPFIVILAINLLSTNCSSTGENRTDSITARIADSISTMKEVKIVNQTWMVKNLNVDRFKNGDLIPEAKTYDQWCEAAFNKSPAWCYYENKKANGAIYGKLYNFWAVNDARGLAPKGWRIPKMADFNELNRMLGIKAGTQLKSTFGWDSFYNYSTIKSNNMPEFASSENRDLSTGYGSNTSGFTALPGGKRECNIHSDPYFSSWNEMKARLSESGHIFCNVKRTFYRQKGIIGGKKVIESYDSVIFENPIIFSNEGKHGCWWISDHLEKYQFIYHGYGYILYNNGEEASFERSEPGRGYSVRCIKE